tara:strand:- start:273 stop:431 length:159 start_codon:yes stop_codon:yes gene_type:complete
MFHLKGPQVEHILSLTSPGSHDGEAISVTGGLWQWDGGMDKPLSTPMQLHCK